MVLTKMLGDSLAWVFLLSLIGEIAQAIGDVSIKTMFFSRSKINFRFASTFGHCPKLVPGEN